MALSEYRRKRNFKKTPEPKPSSSKKSHSSNKLYVIQKHAARRLHYDFRLELNGVLLSWAIPKGPCLDPSVKRLAVQTEDHPVAYGAFEGVIPKGEYGGGTVLIWDTGSWACEDPEHGYRKGHLSFTLSGKKLKGKWHLVRFNKEEKNWFLIKATDRYVKKLNDYDITLKKPKSAVSTSTAVFGKNAKIWHSNKNIKMPTTISPQLATLNDTIPTGKEWMHEIKWDGYRLLSFINHQHITLHSRNHLNWTNKFPNIVSALEQLQVDNAIIDGEVVIVDDNHKTNFQLLKNSIDDASDAPFIYYVFDILFLNNKNVMSLPLVERRSLLKKLISSKNTVIKFSDDLKGNANRIHEKACEMGFEGIISKEKNSVYCEKRTKTWVKTKCEKSQEFVIGGFTKPQGSREKFGALLLGYYDQGKLRYAGNVGTGFSSASLNAIFKQLQKHSVNKNPFADKIENIKNMSWVNPVLIANVQFTEWTSSGKLRHPTFKGLRTDKKSRGIIKEIENPIALSHPEKILYREDHITKQMLASYYNAIAKWILPFLKKRLLTIVRCPDDYHHCFYQKHMTDKNDAFHSFSVTSKKKKENYFYVDTVEGLMSLVQMGTLEMHIWGSCIDYIDYPDMVVFDLDPSPEVPWKTVVKAAKIIKKQLENFGIKTFLKTTGGKGLHIVIPIKPIYRWDSIKLFAHEFAIALEKRHPDLFVSVMSKQKRKNRIFIDYLRNQKGATFVCPYSTRARIHASVSVPIAWRELTDNSQDVNYTIATLPKRLANLKKDPWKDFSKSRQSLPISKTRKL